mgnify:CR=1 FL=1
MHVRLCCNLETIVKYKESSGLGFVYEALISLMPRPRRLNTYLYVRCTCIVSVDDTCKKAENVDISVFE